MQHVGDPINLFMEWYNHDRAYISFDGITAGHLFGCLLERCPSLEQQLLTAKREKTTIQSREYTIEMSNIQF